MYANIANIESFGTEQDLWTIEKIASIQALAVVKNESLQYLQTERNRLLGLSHQETLTALIQFPGLDSRIATVM